MLEICLGLAACVPLLIIVMMTRNRYDKDANQ
jgi:hypothetical protein